MYLVNQSGRPYRIQVQQEQDQVIFYIYAPRTFKFVCAYIKSPVLGATAGI